MSREDRAPAPPPPAPPPTESASKPGATERLKWVIEEGRTVQDFENFIPCITNVIYITYICSSDKILFQYSLYQMFFKSQKLSQQTMQTFVYNFE